MVLGEIAKAKVNAIAKLRMFADKYGKHDHLALGDDFENSLF